MYFEPDSLHQSTPLYPYHCSTFIQCGTQYYKNTGNCTVRYFERGSSHRRIHLYPWPHDKHKQCGTQNYAYERVTLHCTLNQIHRIEVPLHIHDASQRIHDMSPWIWLIAGCTLLYFEPDSSHLSNPSRDNPMWGCRMENPRLCLQQGCTALYRLYFISYQM